MQRTKERGQALVEFALIFPVFMLLLAGMIQFGVILWGQNTLNQVVRDTGRYAATLCSDATRVNATGLRFGTLLTQAGGPWTGGSATVTYTPVTPGNPVCPPDKNRVDWVTVAGTLTAPKFFPWVPGNAVLTSSTEFRVEPAP